jgi:hypothetical protein
MPFVLRGANPQTGSSSSSWSSNYGPLPTSLQLHTRKVAGSIPAGTTGHQCRSGPFRCPDFRSIAHNLAADKRRIVPGARLAAEPVERIRHTIQVGVVEIGVSVRRDHDRGVAHRHLQEFQIGGCPSSAILVRQPTARFQFSSPSREPFGDMMAGSSARRPSIRRFRIGTSRSGIGTLRRPARLFGGPSMRRPDNCVIDLRTRRSNANTDWRACRDLWGGGSRRPTATPSRRTMCRGRGGPRRDFVRPRTTGSRASHPRGDVAAANWRWGPLPCHPRCPALHQRRRRRPVAALSIRIIPRRKSEACEAFATYADGM